MGGTEDRHIKWSKPNPEKQRLESLTKTESIYICIYRYIHYIHIYNVYTHTHKQEGAIEGVLVTVVLLNGDTMTKVP